MGKADRDTSSKSESIKSLEVQLKRHERGAAIAKARITEMRSKRQTSK